MIKKLTAENKKLYKKCSKGPLEVDFYSIYEDDLNVSIDKTSKLDFKLTVSLTTQEMWKDDLSWFLLIVN